MKDYFYIDSNNEQKGPISPLNFSIYNVTPDTLVWCEGMADWTRAGSVDELHDVFVTQQTQATPPPYANNGGGYNQQQAQSFQRPQQTMQPCPDSNLVWAILTTVLCCLPFGVVAIVYACKVNDRYAVGDVQGAIDASQKAKKWSIYSAVTSLVIGVIYLFVVVCLGLASTHL